MTRDESRAVAFLAVLLLLAAAARIVNRPAPVAITASPIDVAALRAAGQALSMQQAPRSPKARSSVRRAEPRPPVRIEPSIGPLDLNRASVEEIDRLPGIGPTVAGRIIARRDSVGRYRRVEDLDSVKGIGPALLDKIRPFVVVR